MSLLSEGKGPGVGGLRWGGIRGGRSVFWSLALRVRLQRGVSPGGPQRTQASAINSYFICTEKGLRDQQARGPHLKAL